MQHRLTSTLLVVLIAVGPDPVCAQRIWEPSPGHSQMALWPGTPPDATPTKGPEVLITVVDSLGKPKLVGGRPWEYIDQVAQPSMTVYQPTGRTSGAAVLVFPGGGYSILAIDLEGSEACDWLTSKGITCVLVKYRVPCRRTGPYRECRTALQDALRAMRLTRFNAAKWHIDPHKIGVLGFSAGGHLVVATSTQFNQHLYRGVDAADSASARPDFAIALYPGHIVTEGRLHTINPSLRITSQTPPTLLVQAEDDPVDPVENSIMYHDALRRAGVPVELHLFVKGGHAFGLRRTTAAITGWPELAEQWLTTIGVMLQRPTR